MARTFKVSATPPRRLTKDQIARAVDAAQPMLNRMRENRAKKASRGEGAPAPDPKADKKQKP